MLLGVQRVQADFAEPSQSHVEGPDRCPDQAIICHLLWHCPSMGNCHGCFFFSLGRLDLYVPYVIWDGCDREILGAIVAVREAYWR
jgi:hypothetical protein